MDTSWTPATRKEQLWTVIQLGIAAVLAAGFSYMLLRSGSGISGHVVDKVHQHKSDYVWLKWHSDGPEAMLVKHPERWFVVVRSADKAKTFSVTEEQYENTKIGDQWTK